MRATAALLLASSAAAAAAASALPPYRLEQACVAEDFFEKWDFWTHKDPTKGFVEYVDQETARTDGLARAEQDRIYMGADFSGPVSNKTGRRSVRIESKETYNSGLFIASLDHIPTGCGTWPAMWMYGEDSQHVWPRWGEWDIIEGAHMTDWSMSTLHTRPDCDEANIQAGEDFTSNWEPGADARPADDCDINARGQWHNQGCSQRAPEHSMGPAFNALGGGTYAAEWDPLAGHIRSWFWQAGAEPADIAEHRPQPSSWGQPISYFSLKPRVCSPDHFKNMRFTFDLTFCGDLGGPTFESGCPGTNMTCEEFVAAHPENLTEAYWSIRKLDVYQRSEAPIVAPPGEPSTTPAGPTAAPPGAPGVWPKPPSPLRPGSHSGPAFSPPQVAEPWKRPSASRPSWPREIAACGLAVAAVLAVGFLLRHQMSQSGEWAGGLRHDAGRSLRFDSSEVYAASDASDGSPRRNDAWLMAPHHSPASKEDEDQGSPDARSRTRTQPVRQLSVGMGTPDGKRSGLERASWFDEPEERVRQAREPGGRREESLPLPPPPPQRQQSSQSQRRQQPQPPRQPPPQHQRSTTPPRTSGAAYAPRPLETPPSRAEDQPHRLSSQPPGYPPGYDAAGLAPTVPALPGYPPMGTFAGLQPLGFGTPTHRDHGGFSPLPSGESPLYPRPKQRSRAGSSPPYRGAESSPPYHGGQVSSPYSPAPYRSARQDSGMNSLHCSPPLSTPGSASGLGFYEPGSSPGSASMPPMPSPQGAWAWPQAGGAASLQSIRPALRDPPPGPGGQGGGMRYH